MHGKYTRAFDSRGVKVVWAELVPANHINYVREANFCISVLINCSTKDDWWPLKGKEKPYMASVVYKHVLLYQKHTAV